MLEHLKSTCEHDGDVEVEAKLNGSRVKFRITREAINDFLRMSDDGKKTGERLTENWASFEPALEKILSKHSHENLIIKTEML
ncbi:hypothetical protein [Chromobacterium subtsugae]|uniref:hypothetical protein n=1 Tax=Chromobacterium subtsugae TaxID=251747 RepID=UPI000B04B240|nr:hypothetical protein [Chromobacterium subtsugae]